MKSYNIVKKLEEQGYKIIHKKWGYQDTVPHVELDGFDFAIAERKYNGNWQSCCVDFIYNHVLEALDLAKTYNPIILKKIEESPTEDYYYLQYMITSMENYYMYKKGKFPYNNYWEVINKLEKELNKQPEVWRLTS